MENGQSFEWQQATTYLPMSFDWFANYTQPITNIDITHLASAVRKK